MIQSSFFSFWTYEKNIIRGFALVGFKLFNFNLALYKLDIMASRQISLRKLL